MNFLRKLFDQPADPHSDPNFSEDLNALEKALGHLPPDDARYLAGFALLLARVAFADRQITTGERQQMQQVLIRHSKLGEKEADLVVELAMERTLATSLEEHLVFRHLNKMLAREQKLALMQALFHSATEGDISLAEEQDLRFITKALLLSDRDFLAIRSEYTEHLAILKNLPGRKS